MSFPSVGRALGILVSAAALSLPVRAQPSPERIRAGTDSIVAAAIEEGQSVSFQVGVERTGDVIVERGYGTADLEHDIPASERTVYRLGSITKQFTASAIMQLVEQGKIALDDEITTFLPDYPTQGHRVTIHHLLTHTSGIKSYTGLGPTFWDQAARDLTHDQMLDLFKNEPFDFDPGDEWRYNNSGYYLLGVIIEKVSGQDYDDYLQEHIFGPLGLSGSSYCHESTIIPDRAQGYRRDDGEILNDAAISMNTPGAAGALCSTVGDLMAWQDAFNHGRVVSAHSRQQMIAPAVLNDGSATSYGYGLGIGDLDGHAMIAHGGGINGFNTQLSYFPDDDVTVVVLANTEGSNPGRVARDIARLVLGTEAPDVLDLTLSQTELAVYAGTYRVDDVEIEVTAAEDGLHVQAPGLSSRLLAQGDHGFRLAADADVLVTFAVDGNRATSFTLQSGGVSQSAQRVEGR